MTEGKDPEGRRLSSSAGGREGRVECIQILFWSFCLFFFLGNGRTLLGQLITGCKVCPSTPHCAVSAVTGRLRGRATSQGCSPARKTTV